MIGAFEASARVTSDSVMAPTPEWSTRTTTSSLPILSSAWDDRLGRALHVGLDQYRQFGDVAGLCLGQKLVQCRAGALGRLLLAGRTLAVVCNLAGLGFALDHVQDVACLRRTVEAQHLDGNRWACVCRRGRPGRSSAHAPCPIVRPRRRCRPCMKRAALGPGRSRQGRDRCPACASITAPSAARFGLALSSSSSDWSTIASISLSSPSPVIAEHSTSSTSPDISSTMTSCCRSWVRTLGADRRPRGRSC